ncbi:MAG: LysR family transcriptional regulator, partial [Pseudomonas alloputida]
MAETVPRSTRKEVYRGAQGAPRFRPVTPQPAARLAPLAHARQTAAPAPASAARALGLTPSAVSRILARTEQRLGTRLLLRTIRALTLTPEGEAYLRGARRVLADMLEVEEAITDQGVPRGRLRVSAALGHARLTVVPLLAAFSARYPQVLVDLTLSDEVADILGGQADV